jgi:hypothetical protein
VAEMRINDPKTFPELSLYHLQDQAKLWVKIIPGLPIENVALYRYRSKFQRYYTSLVPTKFAVVFKFFNTDEYTPEVFQAATPAIRSVEEMIDHIKNEEKASDPVKKYKEFVGLTEYYNTSGKKFFAFMDSSFSSTVYLNPPKEEYKYEWTFIPIVPGKEIPLGISVDRPFWVLWEREVGHSLETILQEAKFNGSIQLANLAYVFADSTYNETLELLWRKFVANNKNGILRKLLPSIESVTINLNSNMHRQHHWNYLWGIFANTSDFQGIFKKLSPKISPIDLYKETRCQEKIREDEERKDEYYVKLEDLKSFIKKIEECFNIPFPLPKSLFPDFQEIPKADETVNFSLFGDYWTVNYNGESKNLKDLKRLRYIIRLLENPNKEFSHIELQTLVSGTEANKNENYSKMSDNELEDQGFSKSLHTDELSDYDKDSIEKLIFKNWDDETKRPSIQGHLFNEYGVQVFSNSKGEPVFRYNTRLNADAEKARVNVTKHISKALNDLKDKFPTIYDHLKNRIHTDKTCRYEVSEADDPGWNIQWK